MRNRILNIPPSCNICCKQSKEQNSFSNFYDQNTKASFFPGIYIAKMKHWRQLFQKSYSWYWVSTVSTNAGFGISVSGFHGRIYTFTRANPKLHEPCEVLARIWKDQKSPQMLPWIFSVLKLTYAKSSKFTASEIMCGGAKKLQH